MDFMRIVTLSVKEKLLPSRARQSRNLCETNAHNLNAVNCGNCVNECVSWLLWLYPMCAREKSEEEFHLKINDEIYFMANCTQLKLNASLARPQLLGPSDLLIAVIHKMLCSSEQKLKSYFVMEMRIKCRLVKWELFNLFSRWDS